MSNKPKRLLTLLGQWLGRAGPVKQSPLSDEAAQLLGQRVVLLRGVIDDNLANLVIAQLLFLSQEAPAKPLKLNIDSFGGSVAGGLTIVDTIKFVSAPVQTCCTMNAHGIAAIILACGQRSERVVLQGSSLSISEATSVETPIADSVLSRAQHRLADQLAELTGRSPDIVAHDMTSGRWFDATEAVEYGLADRVE